MLCYCEMHKDLFHVFNLVPRLPRLVMGSVPKLVQRSNLVPGSFPEGALFNFFRALFFRAEESPN